MPDMYRHTRFMALVALLVLIPAMLLSVGNITAAANIVRYEFQDKSGLQISLKPVNPGVRALSADPENELVMKAEVRDATGTPVPEARFKLTVADVPGRTHSSGIRTGADGSCLVTYSPPAFTADAFKNGTAKTTISASIPGSEEKASISFDLVRVPVVFVHGYKATPAIFDNFKEYLETRGFKTTGFGYNSDNGVTAGAAQLGGFLDQAAAGYLKDGLQVKRFDVIAHSMGGLVARYYTCSTEYTMKNNVDKLIFLSVPHRGSPLASLGVKYYNDSGILDLIPDSSLFTSTFPSMINKGLNSTIQVGNILDQYDEVVTPESASLEEWNIRTELFSVGENNFTVDKLLNGNIIDAANHKLVLYNKKIFQRVEEMLGSELPHPLQK